MDRRDRPKWGFTKVRSTDQCLVQCYGIYSHPWESPHMKKRVIGILLQHSVILKLLFLYRRDIATFSLHHFFSVVSARLNSNLWSKTFTARTRLLTTTEKTFPSSSMCLMSSEFSWTEFLCMGIPSVEHITVRMLSCKLHHSYLQIQF